LAPLIINKERNAYTGNHGFVFAILPLTRTTMHLFSLHPRNTTPPRTHRNASQPAQCLLYRDSARSPDRFRSTAVGFVKKSPSLSNWRNNCHWRLWRNYHRRHRIRWGTAMSSSDSYTNQRVVAAIIMERVQWLGSEKRFRLKLINIQGSSNLGP
jgi:hypothetical protein